MQELNMEQMEQINGGVKRVVNTGTSDKAAVRRTPTRGESNQIAALVNGTVVDTIDETNPVYDSYSGRHFVQITFTNSKGKTETGWIAASIVGLPR